MNDFLKLKLNFLSRLIAGLISILVLTGCEHEELDVYKCSNDLLARQCSNECVRMSSLYKFQVDTETKTVLNLQKITQSNQKDFVEFQTFTNCLIKDKKNWKCSNSSESKFEVASGMFDGVFYSYILADKKYWGMAICAKNDSPF